MKTITNIMIAGAVLALFFPGHVLAAKKPLKVYILAGQSNMQGSAHKRTFAAMGDDPISANLLNEILDKKGNPVVSDNAWITYLTKGENGDASWHGRVEVGYGFDDERIDPEYAFGLYMDKALREPVLIIKTAWGGKSLAVDFRPPGAGPYVPSLKEKEQEIWDRCASNAEYHYLGSGKTFIRFGKALAQVMLEFTAWPD